MLGRTVSPVDVQSIEAIVIHELHDIVRKFLPVGCNGSNVAENWLRCSTIVLIQSNRRSANTFVNNGTIALNSLAIECPPSHRDEDFEITLVLLSVCRFLEQGCWCRRVHGNNLERIRVDIGEGEIEMGQCVHCLELTRSLFIINVYVTDMAGLMERVDCRVTEHSMLRSIR